MLAGEGEVGMVRIRGACVMRGYWNDPARTAKAFDSEGWLLTGDLGYLDADGNLVLTGRSSDMYIRGGYNVYPAEVESLLVTHPKVANVGIVAAPAPIIGEIGVAFVVPTPGETVTLDELREFVRRNLADYKAPDVLHVIRGAAGERDAQDQSSRAARDGEGLRHHRDRPGTCRLAWAADRQEAEK